MIWFLATSNVRSGIEERINENGAVVYTFRRQGIMIDSDPVLELASLRFVGSGFFCNNSTPDRYDYDHVLCMNSRGELIIVFRQHLVRR